MDTPVKNPNFYENALFAFLGALTATVLSLGMFGVVDNRGPASVQTPRAEVQFDARVYMGDSI